jgi:hypothetical protein
LSGFKSVSKTKILKRSKSQGLELRTGQGIIIKGFKIFAGYDNFKT